MEPAMARKTQLPTRIMLDASCNQRSSVAMTSIIWRVFCSLR
jgi:hypothetical protein